MDLIYELVRGLHITAGFVSLAAGAGAMLHTKGSPLHRQHGLVFFVSMMLLGTMGLVMAVFFNFVRPNILGSALTVYLTSTAWLTVWRPQGKTGRLEIAAALWGLSVVTFAYTLAVMARTTPRGIDGYPWQFFAVFGSIALLGVLGDVRTMLRGGVTGVARVTRHLWRMSFAFFFATVSFFFGNQRVFTPEIRASGVLNIPVFLVLGAFLYFLIKVRVWPAVRKLRLPGVARTAA